ncbi:glycoside hydrolase family 88 protein [Chitinophagaceae bacterium LB-8]|uniref:Glycoside hydrolase family 88 protein n=1 Tax=Paraflavisolibacter caeni TaxID=2982496 RepID=A0A9X3B6Q3_9BACT|nr:glycoside hydrolase family 88 protein [Paraflavisolibacter caeni]MCU7547551.1 glycoside hydrolase family 88 protein [Paraflavisolibacter caeni]
MKKVLFGCFCFSAVMQLCAQSNETLVRKIADQIINETKLGFEGTENKQFYASSKDIPENTKVKYASPYTGWHYTHGVLNMAMINLGNYLNEPKYTNYAAQHVAFGFDNYKVFQQRFKNDVKHYTYPYGEFFTMDELDDFGAMSASIIEVYKTVKKPEYKEYLEKAAKHLTEERLRLEDGTFVRKFPYQNTLWADDLYMSVPFLARMGKLTGQNKYFDDAIKQVINFNKYLWDADREIYWHIWYSDLKRNGVAHWGRCNGWIMLAQIHLLDQLPQNHPKRKELIQLLERQIVGIARYQNAEGLWHQILDKNDSYTESSCTAMFVYGIAHAVNQGWIDKRYASIATTGWEGLKKHKINELGQLKDICVGTGIQDNLAFYYNRPVGLNEKHGTGPLLDAGVEILKLEKSGK